jgi:hypothetical protein
MPVWSIPAVATSDDDKAGILGRTAAELLSFKA